MSIDHTIFLYVNLVVLISCLDNKWIINRYVDTFCVRVPILLAYIFLYRQELTSCELCPRNCKVDRLNNKQGSCNTGRYDILRLMVDNIHSTYKKSHILAFKTGLMDFTAVIEITNTKVPTNFLLKEGFMYLPNR